MEAWLVIAVIVELVTVITAATAVQYDSNNAKSWIMLLCGLGNVAIIGGMIIYYLINILPIVHGR